MPKRLARYGDVVISKKPSCVEADRDVAVFISSPRKGSYLLKIVNDGLDVLKENMFAGERIERKKFPRIYVQKFGVSNLYKFNLDARTRLVYSYMLFCLDLLSINIGC